MRQRLVILALLLAFGLMPSLLAQNTPVNVGGMQTAGFAWRTVSQLPNTADIGAAYYVIDSTSSTSCSVGGGINKVVCVWDGSGWTAAAASPSLRSYTATAIGTSVGTSLIGSAIQFHKLTWTKSGTVTACHVQVDSSADGLTWGNGDAISSQDCSSNGSVTPTNILANYIRIHFVTSFTGGGSVTAIWTGYIDDPTLVTPDTMIPVFWPGKPGASALIMRNPMTRTVQFPVNLSSSQCSASATATGNATFSIQKNGTEFATATFGAGTASCTFTSATGETLLATDVLSIVAPGTPDATLSDVGITLSGTKLP